MVVVVRVVGFELPRRMIAMPHYRTEEKKRFVLVVRVVGRGMQRVFDRATGLYQALRERLWVPTRPGDARGGDETRIPVAGFTIGMALRCLDGTGEYLSMLAANMLP